MAPAKTDTKSATPRGSPSSGKQSVASNFSEMSLGQEMNGGSAAEGMAQNDFEQEPQQSMQQQNVHGTPGGGGTPPLSNGSPLGGAGTPNSNGSLGSLRGTPVSRRSDSAMSGRSSGRTSSVFGTSPASQFWKNLRPETEIIFVKPLDSRFECALCKNVLRYPAMMDCGHHCCSGCMVDVMRTEPRCPIDHCRVEKGQYSTDRNLQKEIETLFIRCSHVNAGCTWSGYLKELIVHFETCGYHAIPCPNECVAEFERRFLKGHLENDCPRRPVPCQYCNNATPLDEMQPHFEECARFDIQCTNKCGNKSIPREDLQHHLDTECPEQTAPCPFFDSGCPFEAKRKDLKEHVMDALEVHFDMMVQSLRTCSDALEIHDAIWDRQALRLIDVENQVGVLEKLHGHQIMWKIDNYQRKRKEAEDGVTIAVESPMFSLSRDGYRLQMSACLNGDGKASGSYMSLYVCIVKGDYDALLQWPFALQLSITLMDQNKNPAKRKDHAQVLRPNACSENMPFLKRPTTERNPAFGLVRFIELEKLDASEYVKNDCMYIMVKVDPKGILKL